MRAALLAVLLVLLLPAAASAQFEVTGFSVTPSGLQAGSHPDLAIAATFTPYNAGAPPEHVRDLVISLPPGLVGDPSSKPRCAQAAFAADTCPAATRVGGTTVDTVIPLLLGVPIAATGDVYNVVPGPGEPARLGVVVRPPLGAEKVFIVSPVRLRPSDGGLDSVITNMPSKVGIPVLGPVDMWIEGMSLTLESPFVSLPTSCAAAQATVAAVSGAGTASTRAATPFTPTGCDKVPYAPGLEASIGNRRQPSLRTVITVPAGHASTAGAAVTLPAGITINSSALADTCTLAEQAAGPCPARARVGTALARSPLLPAPLTGQVSLAAIAGQTLPGLRLDLTGPASLSLTGSVTGNPILTTFSGIPDVPLERFELVFDAKRSLRAMKDFCRGPLPRVKARLTGHNGAVANLNEPMAVTGCRKPATTVSGRTLRIVAVRGGPAIDRVRVTLPRGMKVRIARADGRKVRAKRRGRTTTVRPAGAREVVLKLRGKPRGKRAVAVRTLDASGREVLQRRKARR